MSKGKRILAEIKEEILRRIKEEGVTAHRAATEHGMNPNTVYGWLRREDKSVVGISWSEHNRLKRENQQLKEIIGHLTLDMSRIKKI